MPRPATAKTDAMWPCGTRFCQARKLAFSLTSKIKKPHLTITPNACSCHEAGAAALLHASQHQLLISAGKKGQVCIWDVRQGRLLHSFKAHEHAVKCLGMDGNETMFATGSIDGDIKIWDLSWHRIVHSYQGEHARHGLFKNISQGVAQVNIRRQSRPAGAFQYRTLEIWRSSFLS